MDFLIFLIIVCALGFYSFPLVYSLIIVAIYAFVFFDISIFIWPFLIAIGVIL